MVGFYFVILSLVNLMSYLCSTEFLFEISSLGLKLSSRYQCWDSPPTLRVDYSSIFPTDDRPRIEYFTPLLVIN